MDRLALHPGRQDGLGACSTTSTRAIATTAAAPVGSYYRCWYNAITLARSGDGGRSYRPGRLLRVAWWRPRLLATAPTWARAASSRRATSWPAPMAPCTPSFGFATRAGRRGTCLIRTSTDPAPGSWRAWDGNGFRRPSSRDPYGTRPRPRAPCAPVGPGRIAEMAESLTYNTALGRLPARRPGASGAESIGPKATGIYFSTSERPGPLERRASLSPGAVTAT